MTQVPMAALLELAATHSGFDVDLAAPDGWMGFGSTHAPLRVWLRAGNDGIVVALSMRNVLGALDTEAMGTPVTLTLPAGAVGARVVADRPTLQRVLRRAWQLSRTLPDELLHAFEKSTRALLQTTEAERLVVQRVGQDLFRAGLMDYWEGRCAVTGLGMRELLRASHLPRSVSLLLEGQDVLDAVLAVLAGLRDGRIDPDATGVWSGRSVNHRREDRESGGVRTAAMHTTVHTTEA